MQAVVRLQPQGDFNSVAPMRIEVANCLFQSAAGKSLIHFAGPDPGEERMKALIDWKGVQHVYSAMGKFMDNEPPPGSPAMPSIGSTDWPKVASEDDPLYKKEPVLEWAGAAVPLTQVIPSVHFNKLKPSMAGAALDLIPPPTSASAPRASGKSEE